MSCVFCEIANNDPCGQVEMRAYGCIVITPLDPVVPGHKLVIPVTHTANAATGPSLAEMAMGVAAELAAEIGDCNIITSVGAAATQTVFHLHVRVVPRHKGDGLALP